MKIQFDNSEWKIFWKYRQESGNNNGTTHCIIIDTQFPDVELLEGKSDCSPRDIFCKSTGRKVSLSKAIKNLPKQQRRAIWNAYDEQIGLVKKPKRSLVIH